MEVKKEYDFFDFEGFHIEYCSLLKMLNDKKIPYNYSALSFQCYNNTYIIMYNQKKAFVYKKTIEVIIQDDNNQTILLMHSDLDMKKYCEDNNKSINNLYTENGNLFINEPKIIPSYKKEIKLIYKKREDLPNRKPSEIFDNIDKNKVGDYSIFYKDYFGYNIDKNTQFNFMMNDTREQIFKNINHLLSSDFKTFKFTGPFNIGKSITLLQYSRLNEDVFYINLKLLSTKQERDCYLLLQEEFSRINNSYFEMIQEKIISSYKIGKKPIDLILEIMQDLSKLFLTFIFIFDQYKINSFTPGYRLKLEELNTNIKIVYCSSINNTNMKDECIKSWKNKITNSQELNEENQNYYFYYANIYSDFKFSQNESVISQITKIKRFKKYYDANDSIDEKIRKTKNHITDKIQEFAKEKNSTLDFVLINIKSLLNRKYKIEDIEFVLDFCPIKYFLVEFDDNQHFQIKIQFPFIKPIINRKLLNDEVLNYFKNKIYLRKLVESETVKGNYFEEAVKIGLQSYINLPKKIDRSIEVNEIATMKEIDKNDFDYNYLEEEYEEDEEEMMDIESSDNNNNIKILEEYMDIEEDEKLDQANIKFVNDKKGNKSDGNQKDNLDKFLQTFDINSEIDPNIIEKSLEWYRQKGIDKLYKGKYEVKISGKKYDGEQTYFLDQRKRTGKTLDCGLLYGEKKDKIFVGFQLKCYFSTTKSLPQKAKNKDIIKYNLRDILTNSLFLLNCKITKWYYYLIFYYNPNSKNCNVSNSIIEKINGIIEVLYYDPVELKFYDINHHLLKKLTLSDTANLDVNKINFGMISINLSNIYAKKCEQILNEKEVEKSFLDDFSYLQKSNKKEIIDKILSMMGIVNKIYRLKDKIVKLPKILTFPSFNHIYLFKRNRNAGFIGVKSYKDENGDEIIESYDLTTGSKINIFENDCMYIYILQEKRKRPPDLTDSKAIRIQPIPKLNNE